MINRQGKKYGTAAKVSPAKKEYAVNTERAP